MIARWELLRYVAGHPPGEGFVLRVEDREGCTGLGEARTIDGYGSGQAALNAFLANRPGVDGLLHRLQSALEQGGRRIPSAPADRTIPAEAIFAAETALFDLASRRAGQDLTSWLGYSPRPSVANSLLVGDKIQARRLAEAGNRYFKLKAGPDSGNWLSLFHALVDFTDGQARIRVDANGSLEYGSALALLSRLPLKNLDYLEQPFAIGNLESCLALKDQLGIRIGIDEGARSSADVEQIALGKAADLIVIKPMFAGLTGSLGLAKTALGHGLGVCVTHSMDGTVGRLAAMHLAAAVGGERPHGLYSPRLPRLTDEPELRPDEIVMPAGPGLGWHELAQDRLRPWNPST